MMERTHRAIREALSKETLEELAKRQERTVGEFLKEIVDEAISAPAIPGHYAPPLLLDARDILDELLHGNIERINVAKVKATK